MGSATAGRPVAGPSVDDAITPRGRSPFVAPCNSGPPRAPDASMGSFRQNRGGRARPPVFEVEVPRRGPLLMRSEPSPGGEAPRGARRGGRRAVHHRREWPRNFRTGAVSRPGPPPTGEPPCCTARRAPELRGWSLPTLQTVGSFRQNRCSDPTLPGDRPGALARCIRRRRTPLREWVRFARPARRPSPPRHNHPAAPRDGPFPSRPDAPRDGRGPSPRKESRGARPRRP